MVAHGGGEGFSCPGCGEYVENLVDQCPKCDTRIERKSDPGHDDMRGASPSEARSSPVQFIDAVQSFDSSGETQTEEEGRGTSGETSVTDANEESDIVQPDKQTGDLRDSRRNLETCNIASASASDEGSKQGSDEEHSGHSGAGEDFAIIDQEHFAGSADSDARSEEDIFADARNQHDEVDEGDSKNESSDSSSMPTWEMVSHSEVATPPGDCDQNVCGKSDVLLDSEIDVIAGAEVKMDQDGMAVEGAVEEKDDAQTTPEKQPGGGGKDEVTTEDQAHMPMNISDAEDNLSDGTQLERRFSGLHVEKADSPGDSGDGETDGQLQVAEEVHVTQTTDGAMDEDVVMREETQSRSSSVDYGIIESNDSASNHSADGKLDESVPVTLSQEPERATIDDVPMESIETDMPLESFTSLYHQMLSLTWDTSDLFCHGNIPLPLCDGYDSDSKSTCNEPVSESKRCPDCGQKNKFVRCKKPHDDGTPCMLFIMRGGSCPCCEAAEKAKVAKVESVEEALSNPDTIDIMCHGDIEPPLCDGYDSDESQICNVALSENIFCSNCGQRNKYVRCKEVHDDGTACMLFMRKGKPCLCCEAAKAATAAKALPPEPPVCDGKDEEGNPCNEPIGQWRFCNKCGNRNEYVQCQGPNGDGSLCKWFVVPGRNCPVCRTVAVGRRPKSKKPVSQEKVQSPVKETELRAKPDSKHARTDLPLEAAKSRLVKEVQPCLMDLGQRDQSDDSPSRLTGNDEARRQNSGRSSLDSVSSADVIISESNRDHSGELGDGDGGKVSRADLESPSSDHDPAEQTISDESTPKEQCKVRELIPKDSAIAEEKLLGAKSTRKSSERPSDEDQKSDEVNAGVFQSSMAVALYKRPDEIGETRTPPADQVFGSSQGGAPQGGASQGGAGDDHPLAHIDRENGNDGVVSASNGDTAVNRGDEGMETSGEPRRKRELEGSHESTSEIGGKKSKDAAAGGTWYQKKDNPPEGYNLRSQDKNKKTKGAENAAKQTSAQSKQTRMRKIRFHVVVHRHFKFDEKTDEIIIRFGHHFLGGWNENRHKMKLVEKYDKGYALMELEMEIPEDVRRSEYKYIFSRPGKNKFSWEYLPNYSKDVQHMINRKFEVPYMQEKQIEFDQYDGLMYPSPENGGFWGQVKKGVRKAFGYEKKEIIDEVKDATMVMLPKWHWFCSETAAGQGLCFGKAEEVINKVDSVFHYIQNSFSNLGEATPREVWSELFWDYLSEWQATVSMQNSAGKWTRDVLEMRLVSALTVLRLIVKLNTLLANETQMNQLCDCLLLRPDQDGQILPFFEILNKNFEKPRNLVFHLLMLCKKLTVDAYDVDEMIQHKWLFLVPLLHLLHGDAAIHEPIWDTHGTNHEDPAWWGIKTFSQYQAHFQRKVDGYRILDLEFLVKHLSPLFQVDYLLPRTLMCVLSKRHIKFAYARDAFPLDCCIANCFYFIKSGKGYILDEDHHHMMECLGRVLEKAKKTYSIDKVTTDEKKDLALREIPFVEKLARDMMKLLLRVTQPSAAWNKGKLMVPIGVQLVVCLLDAHFRMLDWIPKDQQDCIAMHHRSLMQNLDELKASVISYLSGVLKWPIANRLSEFADAVEPTLWSNLLKIEFATDRPRNIWRAALLQALENRIGEISHIQQVEMYCGETDFSRYDKGIEETFSKIAFDVVSKEVNILTITSHNKAKYKRLVSQMFEEAWNHAVGTHRDKILMHLLSWPSFARCLEIFSTDKREILFNDACIAHITAAVSVLSEKKDVLLKHEIRVSDLELLLKHQESFITLCCIGAAREDDAKDPEGKKAKQDSLHSYLTQFFQLRQYELEYFRRTCDKLRVLLGHCAELPCKVHTESFAVLLRENNNKRAMIDIVAPAKGPYEGKNVPKIQLFGLSDRLLGILDKVKTLSTSIILKKLWLKFGTVEKEETGHDATQLPLQIDDAVDRVWQPSWDRWCELISMLNVGNISLKQVDAYFECFRRKFEDIKMELECMRDYVEEELNVEEILKQIELYYKLDGYTRGAVTILKVKKEMELTGDFSQVETLANVTEHKHKPLRSMNRNLLTTGKILENITVEQVECLKAVAKCKELVIWLKDIGGTKELKVFVDLASTTAGEGDMDLDRVSMLHAVVTGYAPLICDLKQDASAEVFLGHCKMVWRALESDNMLTDKLLDTKRHMAWLKFIKDSHGSVEVSSLSEVDAINGRGVYKVGNLKKGHKDIRDVIQLTVPALKDDPKRTYNIDQLNELQSKLMLMSSGKRGNQDEGVQLSQIDRFTEIFEGVTRLAKAYIRICSAGNILFQDWVSTLFCNLTTKNNIRVDFHLEKGILMEKNQGQLTQQIHNLADFMESCLQDWQEYLVRQRGKYPQLNHFTTAQIVLLRSEFATVTSADVKSLTYNMLHSVKTNARREDLIGAVRAAHDYLEAKASPQKEEEDTEMPEEPSENLLDLKERLIDAGFSEKLACLAIQESVRDGYDEDRCMVWCLENRDRIDNADSDDADDEDGDVTMGDDGEAEMMRDLDRLQPTTSMNTVTSELLGQLDRHQKALCDQLKELWDKFLSAVSMSVKDYRSVEHLGLILDRLSDREGRILRTFPPFLRSGRPNLIVCPEADIYNMVLGLYMDDPKLPLPDDEEILLCTNSTTTEEVDLLWQRATCDQMNQGKIYCLVNADRLDYDVSDSVEKSLEKHIKGKKDYRLVIVCSSEREDKSRMVTALDRDRCNPLIRPTAKISEYLKQQFKRDYPGDQSAPKLDYDNCSVRLVKSSTAGVGKTLIATRMSADLKKKHGATVSIPLHERYVTESDLVEKLIVRTEAGGRNVARLFHIDIGHDVVDGVDHVLFNLLVLRCIKDASGQCWRRSPADLYLIENLPLLKREVQRTNQTEKVQFVHRMLNILPSVTCRPPKETLKILRNEYRPEDFNRDDPLLHNDICTSQEFQRPYRYLKELTGRQDTPPFFWLDLLLRYCGVENPSWAELRHFISFLNIQLHDCEHSIFCSNILKDDLPGFTAFVVNFMIQMSKDFATRSLKMSEETPQLQQDMTDEAMEEEEEDELPIALRRTWETSPHPYIFFNPDHHSITFLGFNIDKETGNLIDHQTKAVLKEKIMSKQLFEALNRQGVNLLENFDNLTRADKITKLCTVMGNEMVHDPDETYELTTDNVKKMLAIFMRFRCSIPVVVMGETGCGKTRLIKFMCDLQTQPGVEVKNMVLMKVHGGTSHAEIIAKVKEAQTLSANNRAMFPRMDTILFFDEANTTEAIGLIKEIMCDQSMNGERINTNAGLKFVAACNPYRKHSQEMIHNLEQAGLGYNVKADKTADKLGRVPMRQLVYRVQPLPQSMLPLVWDFGQLSDEVEKMYIRQIVQRYIEHGQLPNYPGLNAIITDILAASQDFMRQQKNECSFVSLRDVERSMDVMSWFYSQRRRLYKLMDEDEAGNTEDKDEEEEETEEDEEHRDDVTRSLILALGVCYHACLQEKTRVEYRDHIAKFFKQPCVLPNGSETLRNEITRCQDVFLEQVKISEPNIAPNQALKENLFMMVVCIELRIPLFLVGKPGSSKSLAKLIVTDAMQGETARTPLFKALKQVHMVSFQCSPLATPDGIKGTFRQCARFQKDKNLDQFVSVVVLDEVGLAEDSPRMPLKTLHPLLEDGTCGSDDEPLPHMKVAFIGISNWALDPAKMNRGILVQRGVPDEEELRKSAEGICSTDVRVLTHIKAIIPNMAKAYLQLYNSALEIREFFGLRDFYSLVKMVYAFANHSRRPPTWYELEHAVLRNFGGLEKTDPVQVFTEHCNMLGHHERRGRGDPRCDPTGLIEACLLGNEVYRESRYLLILTENYAALGILQQHLLEMQDTIVIFGSSFRSDQEYTQVCRNINRIKKCMDTGKTVVLLNLESLYESLYDALNQYYVYMGGQRYVDLGLGTHRVKCRVDERFRLIVVAEKDVVYEKFPIPLINRLEKHFLTMTTVLDQSQIRVAKKVEKWAIDFVTRSQPVMFGSRVQKQLNPGDVFCGFHADTAASIVLQITKALGTPSDTPGWARKVYTRCKDILLACATPDSVLRLKNTSLIAEETELVEKYFKDNKHRSLQDHVRYLLKEYKAEEDVFLEVTSRSHLLAKKDAKALGAFLKIPHCRLLALQAMDTKQQFSRELREFFKQENDERVMLLQCDSGDQNSNLIACARYQIMEEYNEVKPTMQGRAHFVFIVQMPRVVAGSFVGFQGGKWHSVHLDDLRPPAGTQPSVINMKQQSISSLIHDAVERLAMPRQEMGERQETEMETESSLPPGTSTPMPMEVSETSLDMEQIKLLGLDKLPREPSADELRRVMEMSIGRAQVVEGCAGTPEEDGGMSVPCPGPPPTRVFDRTQEVLDVDGLIHACLQGSAAMIKDPDTVAADRPTRRLQILSKELSRQHGVTLMGALRIRIAQLLTEKENAVMTQSLAQDWLSKDAAAPENINRAGTFSRAIHMIIEGKIMPTLAGLIAYLDTNSNLDILQRQRTARDKWICTLWLKMLTDVHVTPLSYEKLLLSPKSRAELTEMIAQQTAAGRQPFQPQFPFSWEVYAQMEIIIQTAKTMKEEGLEKTCQRLFSDSAIGMFFKDFLNDKPETVYDEMVDLYISDFIHMSVRCGQEGMQEILTKTLKAAFRETRRDIDTEGNDLYGQLTIPKLHLTFMKFHERFEHFIQACVVWKECVAWLKKEPGHELNTTRTEMTLDVNILVKMVDYISSLDEKLNSLKGRQEWSETVKKFKPVIDRILHSKYTIGPISQQYMQKYRPLWMRICVVQLFIDHVCPPHIKEEAGRVDSIRPLWMFLGKEVNFRTPKSLTKVAEFLRSCKFNTVKKIYKSNSKCIACEEPMKDPMVLPCKHDICRTCFRDQMEVDNRECLKCKAVIPEDFTAPERGANRKGDESYNRYICACNEFFMDLVSQLCFAEDKPPTQEVIEILMSYVIHEPRGDKRVGMRSRTKELTVYDECIDASPVLRSLLLQLLLRYSSDDVCDHLQYFFERSQRLLKEPGHIVELSLLCARCFEDSYHSHCGLQPGNALKTRVEFATRCMHAAEKDIGTNALDIRKVEAIAKTRFGMSVAAEMMNRIHILKEENHDMHAARRLWDVAQRLSESSNSKWPRLFLVKQLCRNYGMESLDTISQRRHLAWVMPDEARGREDNGVDRFILFGAQYKTVRDEVAAVILGGSVEDFRGKCQGLNGNKQVKEVSCLLALHREVYTRNLFEPNVAQRVTDQTIDNIQNVCMNQAFMNNKQAVVDTLEKVKSNKIGPEPVEADKMTKDVWDLLVQTTLVMQSLKETPLLKPFKVMASQAGRMKDAFLPVMPHDHLEETRAALLAARRGAGDENPVFYSCSRGHPYVIGNCGRPYYTGRCWCGSDIGGQGHHLSAGNVKLDHRDNTQKGYVLNVADMTNLTPIPERSMSPAATTIVRLLLHLSMHIGTKSDLPGVTALIQPPIPADQVRRFLLDHIRHDIQVLGRAINKSPDDCLTLVTILIETFMENKNSDAHVNADLTTKEARAAWEKAFTEAYVNPLLNDLDAILNRANAALVNDERLSNNPLIKIVHEVISLGDQVDISQIHDCHLMWQFRSRVTVEHLTQLMNEHAGDKCPAETLKLFIREEPHLRLLSRLPDIIRLQQLLIQHYQRRITQAEARTITIKELLHSLTQQQRGEWLHLLEVFTSVWKNVKDKLVNYSASGYTLPEEMCNMTVNPNTPIAMLIPSSRGLGLCSMMLVEYLTRRQNDFIMAYCRHRNKDSRELPKFGVTEATAAHLIYYDPEKDLLPMVLAHCNYSLEVGKGTVISYDFVRLERELEERLLRGKPKLVFDVAPMVFKTEYRNARVIFGALRDTISQEPMSHAVKAEILRENRVFQDLCETIASLDITIAWLRDIKLEPETKLVTFMHNTLEMDKEILSPQIQQHCSLMHVQSLWLLLTMERSKQLKYFNQDAFEDVSEDYHEPLEGEATFAIEQALQHLNIDRFVSELYECILLNINLQRTPNDEDFQDNTEYILADVMTVYISSKDGTEILALTNGVFPKEVKVKHAVAVWTEAIKVQRKEEKNRRH
ncbi:E3 ubiquitin-protein ligase rnf213-alpha-like isoform X2 [Lineus longissimus]|uniref:E3 ubiquitin-protein ligase rnf213-alpha-like isoform X2 n=1 Tax=Lineus longissimus TaxID=88925 RepID=UPI00315DC05E